MSSWFQTTDTTKHVTPLPAGISSESAIQSLHNHVSFLKCDPHMIHYKLMSDPPKNMELALPERCHGVAIGEPVYYSVTDRVHKLPAGLWDSDVVSIYEFVNLKEGLFVRLRSQLGVVMETVWDIQEDQQGGFVLVEDVLIKASRLLISVVKSMCDSAWKDIHGEMLSMMRGEEK